MLIHLDYATEHIFDNNYIVISYRFRNALWYGFGKYKTLEKQIKVFNFKNLDQEFDFIVYGWFQKKVYRLNFKPQLTIDTRPFKTKLHNFFTEVEFQTIPSISLSDFNYSIKNPDIKINNQSIQIQTNNYNQTDYI